LADWLIRILSPHGGIILDPFAGSGTTPVAAAKSGRGYIGTEVISEYVEIAEHRLHMVARVQDQADLLSVAASRSRAS